MGNPGERLGYNELSQSENLHNNQITGELPPQTPTNNADDLQRGETLPNQRRASDDADLQRGCSPEQAQGIDLPNAKTDGSTGKNLAEDNAKNNPTGFDPNNGIT